MVTHDTEERSPQSYAMVIFTLWRWRVSRSWSRLTRPRLMLRGEMTFPSRGFGSACQNVLVECFWPIYRIPCLIQQVLGFPAFLVSSQVVLNFDHPDTFFKKISSCERFLVLGDEHLPSDLGLNELEELSDIPWPSGMTSRRH